MRKLVIAILIVSLLPLAAQAQQGVKKRRPLPFEYGRAIIGSPFRAPTLPDVQFDHWLHRAKYTCRLCHVDLGFAMKKNGTGITPDDNIKGYYCGACHNKKTLSDGQPIFGACIKVPTPDEQRDRCPRCHSVGEKVKPKYDFNAFVANFPKERFGNGVDWEKAEEQGLIKPADFLEGVSIARKPMTTPKDFELGAKVGGMPDIIFSHQKHTLWSGCEGCHPEIFSGVKKGATKYSMIENFEGKFCGQCHLNAAFPMTDCQRCHSKPVR